MLIVFGLLILLTGYIVTLKRLYDICQNKVEELNKLPTDQEAGLIMLMIIFWPVYYSEAIRFVDTFDEEIK